MPLIDVKGIHLTHPTKGREIEALRDVSFSASEGEFLSIVGPSGCGKTTMISLVSGLLAPTKGEIFVGGEKVMGPHKNVGMVFQEPTLLEWRTVMENIMLQIEIRKGYQREEYTEKAKQLLKIAGLEDFQDRYPWELSGGMQQRASFCRALVHDPPLLIMDEPFGALDAMTRDDMNIWLQDLWMAKTKTVVFITHDIGEAVFLSDRILVMTARPGRVNEIIDINLPRPRTIKTTESIEYVQYVARARRLLHSDL